MSIRCVLVVTLACLSLGVSTKVEPVPSKAILEKFVVDVVDKHVDDSLDRAYAHMKSSQPVSYPKDDEVAELGAELRKEFKEEVKELKSEIQNIQLTPGPTGHAGSPGSVGPTGVQGPVGLRGQQGQRGLEGAPGKRGPEGIPGERGRPGSDGERGADGKNGAPGDRGQEGPAGAPGSRGVPGQKGDDGVGLKLKIFRIGALYNAGDYVFHKSSVDGHESMYIAEKTFRAAKLPDSDTDSGNWVEFQAPRGEKGAQVL